MIDQIHLENSVEAYGELTKGITDKLMESGARNTNTGTKLTPPPTIWWTEECTQLIEERREAEHEFKDDASTDTFDKYLLIRKKVKRDLRRIKRRSFRAFCQTLTPERNIQEIWNIIKAFKSRFSHQQLNNSNSSLDPEVLKAINKLNRYPFDRKISLNRYESEEMELKKQISEEVSQAIKNLKKKSAAGCDGINYEIIKNQPKEVIKMITTLFNQFINKGIIPEAWSEYVVCLIPKPGSLGFRPIAMANCIFKIMEKMINNRLMCWSETKHILPKLFFCYRKNKSCNDNISILTTDINSGFLRNKYTSAIFLD